MCVLQQTHGGERRWLRGNKKERALKMTLETIIGLTIIGNYFFGMISHIGKDFSIQLAVSGFLLMIKKLIGAGALFLGYVYTKDLDIFGIAYSVIAWSLLSLVGVYNLNSFLLNATNLSGLQDVKILKDLDDKFKELIKKDYPFGIEPEEVETSIEKVG